MAFDIPIADQMRIALRYVKFKTNQKRLRTADKVIADTIYGKVKGVKWQSVYGSPYYSFEGIPFAKPPLGELRFKAPVEPEPWSGIRRCTRQRAKPCQMNIILKQVQGKEDCLYLNVYTRELSPRKRMPVLVWIYGGGFQMGEASRDLYSPDYFMMENVVLVLISYRLGPLGFLSLNDESLDIPGNAGLKDQVLALRWVKNNCHFFGGDPNNITIFGESAGGGSAHYMMLTEQARDLFHKCVVMSGSAIAPWANIPPRNWAYRLAKATGYKGENVDSEVFAFLKNCKASTMCKVSEDVLTIDERHERLTFGFGPTIEPYITEHCVIPKPPLEMMRDCWGNEIPLLIGGNSFEGLLMFTEARKYPDLLHKLGETCEYLTPDDANLTMEERKKYGKMLKEAYFGDKEPNWESILQYSDLFSYKYFWHGIHRTLLSRLNYAPKAPTYLYRFDFDSEHFNFMRIITCGRKVRGTCHADDLSYMFYNAGAKKLKHRTAEYKTIRRLISILVQFAECGDPNIPLTTMSMPYSKKMHKAFMSKAKAKSTEGIASNYYVGSNNGFGNSIISRNGIGNSKGRICGSQIEINDENDESSSDVDESSLVNNSSLDGFRREGGGSLDYSAGVGMGLMKNNQLQLMFGDSKDYSDQSSSSSNKSIRIESNNSSMDADAIITNDTITNQKLRQQQSQGEQQQQQDQNWLPVSLDDKVFKCLNISDELEVIDLPEAEKLKLWDSMYEKSLLY